MASFAQLPLEMHGEIIKNLPIRDQISLVDAFPHLEAISPVQLELSTKFKVKEGKKCLAVVVRETRDATGVKEALATKKYETVFLIIARDIVRRRGKRVTDLLNWMEEITEGGEHKATAIELFGEMRGGGKQLGQLAKYCECLVVERTISERGLSDFRDGLKQVGSGTLVYDGVAYRPIFELVTRELQPSIKIRVRHDRVTENHRGEPIWRTNFRWESYNAEDAKTILPHLIMGLGENADEGSLDNKEEKAGGVACSVNLARKKMAK